MFGRGFWRWGVMAKNSFAEFFFWSYGACSAAIEAMLWIRYGSWCFWASRSRFWIRFSHVRIRILQLKIVRKRKTLISTVLWLLYDFLAVFRILRIPVFFVPPISASGSVRQTYGSASGSAPKCHGSTTLQCGISIHLVLKFSKWQT